MNGSCKHNHPFEGIFFKPRLLSAYHGSLYPTLGTNVQTRVLDVKSQTGHGFSWTITTVQSQLRFVSICFCQLGLMKHLFMASRECMPQNLSSQIPLRKKHSPVASVLAARTDNIITEVLERVHCILESSLFNENNANVPYVL